MWIFPSSNNSDNGGIEELAAPGMVHVLDPRFGGSAVKDLELGEGKLQWSEWERKFHLSSFVFFPSAPSAKPIETAA